MAENFGGNQVYINRLYIFAESRDAVLSYLQGGSAEYSGSFIIHQFNASLVRWFHLSCLLFFVYSEANQLNEQTQHSNSQNEITRHHNRIEYPATQRKLAFSQARTEFPIQPIDDSSPSIEALDLVTVARSCSNLIKVIYTKVEDCEQELKETRREMKRAIDTGSLPSTVHPVNAHPEPLNYRQEHRGIIKEASSNVR